MSPRESPTHEAPVPVLPACVDSYEAYLGWLEAVLAGPDDASAGAAPAGDSPPQRGAPRLRVQRAVGERFQDDPQGPWLVVVPPGTIEVGAHSHDTDARFDEKPRQTVTLPRALAIGVAPVTFQEWDACLAADGTRHRPSDSTWGRDRRPVIHVSWHDAEEYLGWLSRHTGERYRLLSEAEWEYAFWAGRAQDQRFPWGEDAGFRQLRHHGWHHGTADLRTRTVSELAPNPWGLVDLLGNVHEWVADAYYPDLTHLPLDGSPTQPGSRPPLRVMKGGSWLDSPRQLRPTARQSGSPDYRSYHLGFRVAREL